MDNELSTDLLRKYVNRLADELNLGENFDIYCVGGFVFISSVKVEDGMKIVTERRYRNVDGWTDVFDPRKLTKSERNVIVFALNEQHVSQTNIARILACSQVTISNILRFKSK